MTKRHLIIIDDDQGITKPLTDRLESYCRRNDIEIESYLSSLVATEEIPKMKTDGKDVIMFIVDQKMQPIEGLILGQKYIKPNFPIAQKILISAYDTIDIVSIALREVFHTFVRKMEGFAESIEGIIDDQLFKPKVGYFQINIPSAGSAFRYEWCPFVKQIPTTNVVESRATYKPCSIPVKNEEGKKVIENVYPCCGIYDVIKRTSNDPERIELKKNVYCCYTRDGFITLADGTVTKLCNYTINFYQIGHYRDFPKTSNIKKIMDNVVIK